LVEHFIIADVAGVNPGGYQGDLTLLTHTALGDRGQKVLCRR